MDSVVKLKPCVKSYIWGGKFFQKFGKSDLDIVSELWEVSVRGESSSVIASGPLKGKRLDEVLTKADLGPNVEKFDRFPFLIKLIDANDNLSVQVHPSDEYALKYENSYGKTEMWHILSAEKGAGIYVGFKKDYSREEIEEKLKSCDILSCLNFFEAKPGETYMITAGTIHAIGAGVRLYEMQQNSDLTYRLYDYLRKDKDGNYRELHIDKALKVIDYKKYVPSTSSDSLLAKNKYFIVNKYEFDGELEISANEGSFVSFTFVSGKGQVDDISYQEYDSFFLPFGKTCKIKGKGKVIVSRV